jgi:uncharacterized membrane protein YhaH (DUF805 family)
MSASGWIGRPRRFDIMEWDNPFSFKGRIGLGRLWLTLILTSIASVILDFTIPIAQHKITFGSFSSFTFAVPVEPITTHSWLLFVVRFAITIPLAWILVAAIVKRLHDHGRSGKWLLIFVSVVAGNMGLDALLSYLGLPHWLAVTVLVITLVPMCFFGLVGMLEIFLFPGRRPAHT